MADNRAVKIKRGVIHVGIVGLPNAGKSTLINACTGQKTSIVTDKPQTTRATILGTLQRERLKIIFMDAPGLFRPVRTMERIIVKNAVATVREADVLLWVIDSQKHTMNHHKDILQILTSAKKPVIVVLNKVDLMPDPAALTPLLDTLNKSLNPEAVFYISALQGKGLDPLIDKLFSMVVNGARSFLPAQDEYFYACEITREHLFNALHQELPYSVAIANEEWTDKGDSLLIRQTIYVASAKHKPIVVGQGGSILKKVGMAAREELSQKLGKPVSLFLHVVVKEGWQDKPYAVKLINEGYLP